ncbi:MAG: thioredoxin family protein [Desulfobacca sp.]|uniref:thioredoxin family protein n=1 Tax=Desulfobacca sp. TaxID=2067990 RepID=UPI004049245D
MTFASADEQYITSQRSKIPGSLTLRLARNHRPESAALAAFVAAWQRLVPEVPVWPEDVPETAQPGFLIGEKWRFHAVPTGSKLELFLEILQTVAGPPPDLAPSLRERWEKLPIAPELTIFVAPQCPFCPQMVRQLMPLSVANPAATVTLIDVSLFIEEARRQEIKAVPTVIVNDLYRLTGAFRLADLVDLAAKADPALLPTPILERMMQEGQAGVVGEMMLAQGQIFANFLPLIKHPEINIRLGAMVALETVGGARPELVAAILPALWQEVGGSDTAVQGDLIYLIGEWGEGRWLQSLAAARQEAADPDVREALDEAVEKIRERART